jgi:hypothetical protein
MTGVEMSRRVVLCCPTSQTSTPRIGERSYGFSDASLHNNVGELSAFVECRTNRGDRKQRDNVGLLRKKRLYERS